MVIGSFFEYSSWLVKIEYLSVLSIWIYYFVNKWKRSKIMFSPFNFQILFFLFTLLIVSPAQYYYPMANTWTSISTEEFLKHLNEAYAVNLLGMAILGVSTNYYDHKKQVGRGYNKIISFTYYNILSKQIRWIAFIFAIVFFVYIYIGAGGIPLFNGNRQFAQGSNQFVYILLQGAVYFLAWYFVGSASDRKISCYDILCLAVLSADLLFTANRTPPLKIIYAFLIVLITARKKIKYSDIFKQFRYAILIALAGVIIVVVRAGGGLSNITYIFINSIVFGNTFCDIRDGARVLFGYHRMYDIPLMGKTYLASLLSFIPSSLADSNIPILSGIAEFRSIYSAGQWTTYTLFGLTNHYGLRGGMFLLSYMNFGIIGVVLISIVLGYWYGNCEVLYRNSIKYKDSISIKGLLISTCFASAFFDLLYAPAVFNQTWGFLLIIIIFTIIRGKVSLKRRLPNV